MLQNPSAVMSLCFYKLLRVMIEHSPTFARPESPAFEIQFPVLLDVPDVRESSACPNGCLDIAAVQHFEDNLRAAHFTANRN